MKIDSIDINLVQLRAQMDSSVKNFNSRQNADVPKFVRNQNQQDNDNQIKPIEKEIFDLKAVFAVDKEKNVVIRFLDQKGKIVRQIPPEEYIKMIKKFKENVENLFSKEV